ncbi:MAG TPA: tyrosinase family protein [Chthoniobacterales bacterium]|nr:tyrosinase family protein [Chthoniobacterales bacterium]
MPAATSITRYEKVKQILDRAAADSNVDYDGQGQFWHLPLPKLLEVEIGGVRMIAPAQAAAPSCCHPVAASEAEGRGARSGLILGLRGQAPFDGTKFPPLPWGGKPVPESEIGFVSDWIDDGCPASDHQNSFEVKGKAATTMEEVAPDNVEAEVRSFEVYTGSPNEFGYKYGELKQRGNLDCMSEAQLEKFRWAFRELYRLNKWPEDRRSYNNMALVHQNHCQHGWERFLPWHRAYLYEFEQALQDVCPGLTMPYWDWTMPQYCPEHPEKGSIIPHAYKAYLTEGSIHYLVNEAHPRLPEAVGKKLLAEMVRKGCRYTSQTTFFAAVAKITNKKYTEGGHRCRFIDALLASNSLWYPLRYPAEYHDPKTHKPKKINTSIFHYHYPTAADMEQIFALRTFRDFGGGSFYDDSFGFLDQNPHNTMHIWTGGQNPHPPPASTEAVAGAIKDRDRNRGVRVAGRRPHTRDDLYSQPEFGDMLSNLTASYDPVFWPIHVNIDRVWHEWQQLNPHALPKDLDAVLTPWSYTIDDTLDISRFGYEYVKCAFLVPVGLGTPVGRFVSKPIDVPKPVRNSFQRAEVRLHRVPQLPRSCFIRVFLNLPDANASTPITHKNYAGYLAIFGHADCIGGPGHCDLPPGRPRPYDQRPRHHNMPRNHRINVTESARRLLGAKATSLQITLVVIGADYREDNELLRMEGVSLDFLD